jgi:molybdopterin-containing oxidoreductase family iron-sulfur binding subunit
MSETKKNKDPDDQVINKIVDESRRNFLKKVGVAGAATVAGAAAIYSGYRYEKAKSTGQLSKCLPKTTAWLRSRLSR